MGGQEQEVRSSPYPDELLVSAHICLFHLSVGAGWLMEGLVHAVQGPEPAATSPPSSSQHSSEATATLMALPPQAMSKDRDGGQGQGRVPASTDLPAAILTGPRPPQPPRGRSPGTAPRHRLAAAQQRREMSGVEREGRPWHQRPPSASLHPQPRNAGGALTTSSGALVGSWKPRDRLLPLLGTWSTPGPAQLDSALLCPRLPVARLPLRSPELPLP